MSGIRHYQRRPVSGRQRCPFAACVRPARQGHAQRRSFIALRCQGSRMVAERRDSASPELHQCQSRVWPPFRSSLEGFRPRSWRGPSVPSSNSLPTVSLKTRRSDLKTICSKFNNLIALLHKYKCKWWIVLGNKGCEPKEADKWNLKLSNSYLFKLLYCFYRGMTWNPSHCLAGSANLGCPVLIFWPRMPF